MQPILRANISVDYPGRKAVLNGVELDVGPGEIVGIVGESGCGKSTLALAIMRLLTRRRATITGNIAFGGRELLECSESEMRTIRGKQIALSLQSATAALNPALRIRPQLREAWKAHERSSPESQQLARMMRSVELPEDDAFLDRYPSQISAGQAQRVGIAIAIMHRPTLLIVDEPTSALDLINQSRIVALFRSLNREHGVAIVYISHDLSSVASLCDRMYVIKQGTVVESGSTQTIFDSPRHPYVKELVEAMPYRPIMI